MSDRMMTIYFEDKGQDFLEWDLDKDGQVIGCRPGQSWVWIGAKVLHCAEIRKGLRPLILLKGEQPAGFPRMLLHKVERYELAPGLVKVVTRKEAVGA